MNNPLEQVGRFAVPLLIGFGVFVILLLLAWAVLS